VIILQLTLRLGFLQYHLSGQAHAFSLNRFFMPARSFPCTVFFGFDSVFFRSNASPMNYFPVTNSNLSAVHLGYFLQEKYGLSLNSSCRLLKAWVNDTYLVSDGQDRYVFRVYSLNWRTKEEISEEVRLLERLRERNIPVSYPIADAVKNYIQELPAPEGARFGVLFSFAKGEKLLSFSAETHYKIGEIMAQFHQVTHDLKIARAAYTPQLLLLDSFKKLKSFIAAETDEMAFMASAKQFLVAEFKKVNLNEIRQGVVHLDIWFDNLNVTPEGEVTLFDFDFCGNGWLCLDVAYYVLQVHSTEKDESECGLKVDRFLKGYESITRLSNEEKRIIPMLGVSLYFFYLGIQCQRYENWSNSFLNEVYLKRFINLLVKRYFEETGLVMGAHDLSSSLII
jgi:Ser/Thr protein kinase RdoA (MazF antagonist)